MSIFKNLLRRLLGSVRQRDLVLRFRSIAQSPTTLVALLVLSFAAASLGSRGYRTSRWLLAMPYSNPSQLVLISETGLMMGQQLAVSPALLEFWKPRVTTLSGIAGYRWDRGGKAYATSGLFELLGGPPRGFVSPRIRSWHPLPQGDTTPLGVIARLKPGVTIPQAEVELRELAATYRRHREHYPFPKADITPLMSRLRQPFVIYLAICSVAVLAPLIAILVGIVAEVRRRRRIRIRYWVYFAIKAIIVPITLAGGILEFTPVSSLNIVGSASFAGEPFMVWLFMVVCICWIRWCFVDQYRCCRVCMRHLRLPVTIGILGAVILDTAGTELACSEGHGALYLPEESSDYVVASGWSDLLSS